jgi:hypothetical protein
MPAYERLVAMGASPAPTNRDGFTPALHLIYTRLQMPMYDRLVAMGASPAVTNRDGLTPFSLAARNGVWAAFNHIWDTHYTEVRLDPGVESGVNQVYIRCKSGAIQVWAAFNHIWDTHYTEVPRGPRPARCTPLARRRGSRLIYT